VAKSFHTYHVMPNGTVTDPSNPGGTLDPDDDIQDQADDLMAESRQWARQHQGASAAADDVEAGDRSGVPRDFNEDGDDDEDDEQARGPFGPKMPKLGDLPSYTLIGQILRRFA
jgi:hypothetical protein